MGLGEAVLTWFDIRCFLAKIFKICIFHNVTQLLYTYVVNEPTSGCPDGRNVLIYEPPHGITNNPHRRKQRRRSASR